MEKRAFLLFFLFCFAWFFLFSQETSAQEDYIKLGFIESEQITKDLLSVLTEKWMDFIASGYSTPEEEAVIVTVRKGVRAHTIDFFFLDLPEQGLIITLKAVLKTASVLASSNTAAALLGELEEISVEKAKEKSIEWFSRNKMKVGIGELPFSYISVSGKREEFSIPYIVVFKPKIGGGGNASVSFYSSKTISPPESKGNPLSATLNDFRYATDNTLPPFILRIKGEIKELPISRALFWDGKASIDIAYPDYVPELNFEKMSLSKRLTRAFVEEFINIQLLVTTGKKILAPFQGIADLILEKIDWLFSDELDKLDGLERGLLTGAFFDEIKEKTKSPEDNQASEELEPEPEPKKEPKEEELLVNNNLEPEEIEEAQSSCSAPTNPVAQMDQIVFNEIAWMGAVNSGYDEWIELKNIANQTISLKGWQIIDKEGQIKMVFGDIALSPGSFLLLERTDDESAPNITADEIYKGGLSNSSETLYLFNEKCEIEDWINALEDWPAGDNETKRTMERSDNLDWQTSDIINGTPRRENSQGWEEPEVLEEPENIEELENQDQKEEDSQSAEACPTPAISSAQKNSIILNEIAWMGTTTSSYDEWIELKNISNQIVVMQGWQLIDKEGQIKVIFEDIALSPDDFLLLERTDDEPVPSQKADLIYTGGLSNTDEALYLFNKECGLEDAVATASPWPAGDNETKRTMERSDNLDWQTSASINGTPKQKNGEAWQGESNSANNNNASNYSGGGSSEEIYSPPQILITEIQIEGSQDFVELYNPTNSAQDLTGSKLRKKTQAGSEYSLYSFSGETSVPAKTYRIWASSKNSYHQEIGSHFSTSAYLTENNSVALLDKNGDSVDKLAWGQDHNNPFLETVAFPSNPETYDPLGEYFSEIGFTGSREPYSSTLYPQSVGRKIENEEYKDTGDNSADFEIQSPTPKNENRTFETKTIEQVLLEIDSTPPTVQITFNPLAETNQQDAKFTFEANEENCIFNCEIDSGGWEECASPKEYNGLSDGEHAFRVEASDIFQNTSDAVSYSWTIDISIESALILLKDKQTASSNFTNNQIVDAEITQDDEAEAWFLAENQSEQPMQEHESWQEQRPSEFELSQDQGEKTVFIWTKDILGNISALGNNTSIVFDDMPPSSVIIGLEQEQSQTTFTIEWSGSDGENGSEIDSYEIQKKEGGNDWAVWYEGSQTSKNFTGNDGITYYFKSRAIDKAGNTEAWPETAETFTYVNVSIPSRPIISNPENRAIISPEQDQNETEDGIQIMVSGTTDTGTNVFVDGNAVDTSPENNWSFEATLATGVNNFNIWCEEVDGDLSEQVIFELTLEPEETGSGEVVINEIAWMGTEASHTDEWIELYNTTGEDIELEGWTLNAEDGSPEITLANTISANGFYLLERTDDNTISDILADWTGAFGNGLHNDGESLELRDNENNLIDKLDCEDEWFAGGNESSTTRTTMERISPTESGSSAENWVNNNGLVINGVDAEANLIRGTPKQPNSVFSGQIELNVSGSKSQGDKIVLQWTAPQTPSAVTEPFSYDIRYGFTEITEQNWGQAMQIQNEPNILDADSLQEVEIEPLNYGRTYYFAGKLIAGERTSKISNSPSASTENGTIASIWPSSGGNNQRTYFSSFSGISDITTANFEKVFPTNEFLGSVGDVVIGEQGRTYIATKGLNAGAYKTTPRISGLDESHETSWTYLLEESEAMDSVSLILAQDGTLFALSDRLLALDRLGNKLWEYQFSSQGYDDQMITLGENIYVFNWSRNADQTKSTGHSIFCFNLDGTLNWYFDIDEFEQGEQALHQTLEFKYDAPPGNALVNPFVSANTAGVLFFSYNNKIWAFDPEEAEQGQDPIKWVLPTGGVMGGKGPTISGNSLYLGVRQEPFDTILSINTDNATTTWETPLMNYPSSPMVINQENILSFGYCYGTIKTLCLMDTSIIGGQGRPDYECTHNLYNCPTSLLTTNTNIFFGAGTSFYKGEFSKNDIELEREDIAIINPSIMKHIGSILPKQGEGQETSFFMLGETEHVTSPYAWELYTVSP